MIYIHFRALDDLLNSCNGLKTLTSHLQVKAQVRDYRHQVLIAIKPDLRVGHLPEGKPISMNDPDFVFNHSHSQNYYALAWSNKVSDLGIDIEDLNRSVKMEALAKRSFHPNEYKMWKKLDNCREFWFKVWTIKEAVLKAHGMGIRIDLHSIDTQAHPDWDFGRVIHPLLGDFYYQNIKLTTSMMTVAYRASRPYLSDLSLDIK